MLSSIAIILVEPENPDNIGAVARAMKNMGLSDLRLVSPPKSWKKRGKKLAMSAADTLFAAKSYRKLSAAVTDLNFMIGTSRRTGQHRGRFEPFDKSIDKILKLSKSQKIGILFGKESKGLDRESTERCDWLIMIPSHEAYPSLNLAQAVMTVAFSLYRKSSGKQSFIPVHEKLFLASKGEQREAMKQWEAALRGLNYTGPREDLLERILATTEGIFKRNGMLVSEAQMIKGLSRRILQIAGGARKKE